MSHRVQINKLINNLYNQQCSQITSIIDVNYIHIFIVSYDYYILVAFKKKSTKVASRAKRSNL